MAAVCAKGETENAEGTPVALDEYPVALVGVQDVVPEVLVSVPANRTGEFLAPVRVDRPVDFATGIDGTGIPQAQPAECH